MTTDKRNFRCKKQPKINYKPYNIDTDYEYNTYKNVGTTYGNHKIANKGTLLNFIRFYKVATNKNEKKFKVCNTYTDWNEHIKEILTPSMTKPENLIHWLIYKKRDAELQLEAIKAILIPVYIALFSVSNIFYQDGYNQNQVTAGTTIIALIMVVISAYALYESADRLNFYDDFIEVVKNEYEISKMKNN